MAFFSFCNWRVSLSAMPSSFIHAVACFRERFLFKTEQYFIVCKCQILFSHSYVDGCLCCFYLSAIVNNAAMYKGVQIFLQVSAFKSLGYIPRIDSIFNFRGTTIPFFIAAAAFYIPSNSAQRFQFLCIPTNTVFSVFIYIYIFTILMSVRGSLFVILIFIQAMMSHEGIFRHLLAISISSLQKCLQVLCSFKKFFILF